MHSEFITDNDIGIAYRKAKADLFYSPRICREELSNFEAGIVENLMAIKTRLTTFDRYATMENWWTLVPHKMAIPKVEDNVIISSDPQESWEEIDKESCIAEFRVMENMPIEFHVISALWIAKIGSKFDSKLGISARANRLRRDKEEKINRLSLGSTVPYLNAYCKWRDDSFEAMQKALLDKKSIITIATDINSFYHKIDPAFLINPGFIKKIGVILSDEEAKFNRYFVESIIQWAKCTPLNTGLPVGLTAASIMANIALFELDQFFEKKFSPIYYARYVDDIILVVENVEKLKQANTVWDWLSGRSNGVLVRNDNLITYHKDYLEQSEIQFSQTKTKFFFLSRSSGLSTIESIRKTIQLRTSEWRALPNLPDDDVKFEASLLSTLQKDGSTVDSLRKADKISIRRAEFSIMLRDIESYARALDPKSWEAQRLSFLSTFLKHIVTLPTFFDYFNYLPRIIAIANSCGDFVKVGEIIASVSRICDQIQKLNPAIKSCTQNCGENLVTIFRQKTKSVIRQTLIASIPSTLSAEKKKEWRKLVDGNLEFVGPLSLIRAREEHNAYLARDLAYQPLKANLLPKELKAKNFSSVKPSDLLKLQVNILPLLSFIDDDILIGVAIAQSYCNSDINGKAYTGLLFPTRPFGLQDTFFLLEPSFTNEVVDEIKKLMLAFRGFVPTDKLPHRDGKDPQSPIKFSYSLRNLDNLRIGVASWQTSPMSWNASIIGQVDPDKSRYNRLNHLLNHVMHSRNPPNYLIFPELSIPPNWFLSIANKLKRRGINLVSGIEYLSRQRKRILNQVWVSLIDDSLGFNSLAIYRQEKQSPAQKEESDIWTIGGKILGNEIPKWSEKSPPVISHGGFCFAILICSELTNAKYRASLTGRIDSLFVPEWNKDLNGFSSLVESSALDIHAYIAQCNDRSHGDSRVRSPYKDDWERDVIRIKGGIDDYYVVGEILTRY